MTRTIYEVAKGDYVTTGTGTGTIIHTIACVEAEIDQVNPLHYRRWNVVVPGGIRISMYAARAYYRRGDDLPNEMQIGRGSEIVVGKG